MTWGFKLRLESYSRWSSFGEKFKETKYDDYLVVLPNRLMRISFSVPQRFSIKKLLKGIVWPGIYQRREKRLIKGMYKNLE